MNENKQKALTKIAIIAPLAALVALQHNYHRVVYVTCAHSHKCKTVFPTRTSNYTACCGEFQRQ